MTRRGDIGSADIETPFDHGEPRVVDVYNGRDHLGSVCVGRSIRAVTPAGEEIGTFDSVADARRAIVLHAYQSKGAAHDG